MNKNERIVLFLLACLNFTHILDFMIMMPLGNYLMPFFKISPQQFTFLVASYTISAGVSGFASAFFVDGFDRKRVLIIAYSGFLLSTFGCGFAPTFEFLLIARTIAGLFGGLIGAQVISIVADIFPYERRGRAMGSIMSAFAVASTVGIPLALYLANIFSWHAPFIFIASLGLILVPLLIRYLPAMNKHLTAGEKPKISTDGFFAVFSDRAHYKALIFSGLVMLGHFMIIPFINPYMEFNLGYHKDLTPLIYLAGGIASFGAAFWLGRLADKKGKLTIFTICIITALPLVILITNLPHVPYALVLALFAVWFSVATGRGITAQAMVSNVVKPEHRGSFQSFNGSVQQLGTAAASIISGFIITKDPNGSLNHYPWLGIISVVVLTISLLIARNIFGDKKAY